MYDESGIDTIWILHQTAIEVTGLFMAYIWLMFVGYTVFSSKDYLKREYWPFFIPIPLLLILFIINIFHPILFKYDQMDFFIYYPAYYVIAAVEVVYILVSGVLICRNNINSDRMRRFRIAPVLIPVAMVPLVYLATGTRIGPICYTVAIIFMFFSMTARVQYYDEEPGFYNRAYRDYMGELVKEGRKDYKNLILLKCEGDDRVLADIIRGELPSGVEKVHYHKGEYEVFSEHGSESYLDMICGMLSHAAEEYDRTHPGSPLRMKCERKKRDKGESAYDFIVRTRS